MPTAASGTSSTAAVVVYVSFRSAKIPQRKSADASSNLTATLSMSKMIAQASKKQKCMKIEPETGVVHNVEDESSEQEERKALANLGLWKFAGYDSRPSFLLDTGNLNCVSDPVVESMSVSGEAAKAKSLDYSLKGYMECSLLLSMTDLVSRQEYLTLQTCSRPSIQPRGIALPPGQVVEMRRKEYSTAQGIVISGLVAARKVMYERRVFAKGILQLRKSWRVLSHSSILASKKNLSQRTVQSRDRDVLYVDCSYVSCGDKVSSLDEFLVPLGIGPRGPVIGAEEEEIICKTLKIAMKHRSSGNIIASVCSWDIRETRNVPEEIIRPAHLYQERDCLIESESKVGDDMEVVQSNVSDPSSLELDEDLIVRITAHCRRRQHDAMNKRLFARLRYSAILFT